MLFVFSITIPFDIRDVEADAESNVVTIPAYFGEHKAKMISYASLLTMSILVFIHSQLSELIGVKDVIAVAVCNIISVVAIAGVNKYRSEFYYAFLIEGLMILYFLMIVSLSQ